MADQGNYAFGGVQRSYSFDFFHADAIPNSLGAVQCPDMPCEQISFKNDPGSAGNILIGDEDTLLITGEGYPLAPGETTGWVPIKNLNLVWHKDAADSTLKYMIIR